MSPTPGQIPGHEVSGPALAGSLAGYAWGDYLEELIRAEGTLAAVAQKLLNRGVDTDDIGTIERALRRLRQRGQRDGGVWGQRLLRTFGVPSDVRARVRWMGFYHTPFTDLPVELCLDLLRVWDRPPVSDSKARVYLLLGFANCALRQRQFEQARVHLEGARSAGAAGLDDGAAGIELALAGAYLEGFEAPERAVAHLLEAEEELRRATLDGQQKACFLARLVDQWAFRDNREKSPEGRARALGRYLSLPIQDVHPFASYRREAGLASGHHILGDDVRALSHVRAALRHAGDGGYVRLRVMGLLLEAKIDPKSAHVLIGRALCIAQRLGDSELHARVERATMLAQSADQD